LGPRWDCLQRVRVGADRLSAVLELPEAFAADLHDWLLHPALLDAATGMVPVDGRYLPFSYGRVVIFGRLPRRIHSSIRSTTGFQPQSDLLVFDVTILDDEGMQLLEIEGYTLIRVGVDAERAGATNPLPRARVEGDGSRLAVVQT